MIEALLDLLTDSDKNVCAVAAISLARTGASGPRVSNGFQHAFYYLMLSRIITDAKELLGHCL